MDRPLMNGKQMQEKTLACIERKTKDVSTYLNFPEEITHLKEIKVKLDDALKSYDETVKRYDREYMDSKRYLANYRHEIDPKEIFQNEIAAKQIERAGILAVHMQDRIAKLVDSPYFARIDFREEGDQDASIFYIGRFSLDGVIQFEPDRDPLETDDPAWAERVRFKSGIDFVDMMDQYLEHAALAYFEPIDYEFGRFKATKEWILTRYNAYRNYPVKRRLHEVSVNIHDRFHTENLWDDELPKQKVIYKKLVDMFKIKNTLALYKDFYRVMKIPEKLVMPDKKTILGDFGQSLNPNHSHSLNDFRRVYQNAEIVELNKSYRSTYEIITFAKRIQNVAVLEPVERHGDTPEIIAA